MMTHQLNLQSYQLVQGLDHEYSNSITLFQNQPSANSRSNYSNQSKTTHINQDF